QRPPSCDNETLPQDRGQKRPTDRPEQLNGRRRTEERALHEAWDASDIRRVPHPVAAKAHDLEPRFTRHHHPLPLAEQAAVRRVTIGKPAGPLEATAEAPRVRD